MDGEYDWFNNKEYVISLLNTSDNSLQKELLLYKNFSIDYFCDGLEDKKKMCGYISKSIFSDMYEYSETYKYYTMGMGTTSKQISPPKSLNNYTQYCHKDKCNICKTYFDKVMNSINRIESLASLPSDTIIHVIKNTNITNKLFFTVLTNKIIANGDDEKLHAILTNCNTNEYAIMFDFSWLPNGEKLEAISKIYTIDPKVFIVHAECSIKSWTKSAEYLLQQNMMKSFDWWFLQFSVNFFQKKYSPTLSDKICVVTFYRKVYHNHFDKFLSWIIEKNTPYMDKTNFSFCISDDDDDNNLNNLNNLNNTTTNFFTLMNNVSPSYITDTILLKIMLTDNDYLLTLTTIKKILRAMSDDINNLKKHTIMTLIYYDLAQNINTDKELYDIIFSKRPDCLVELVTFVTVNLTDGACEVNKVKYDINDIYYLCSFYNYINSDVLIQQFYFDIFKLVDEGLLDLTKLTNCNVFKFSYICDDSSQSTTLATTTINKMIEFLIKHNSLTREIIFDNIIIFMNYANNDNCAIMINAIRSDERFSSISEDIFRTITGNLNLSQSNIYNLCRMIFSS